MCSGGTTGAEGAKGQEGHGRQRGGYGSAWATGCRRSGRAIGWLAVRALTVVVGLGCGASSSEQSRLDLVGASAAIEPVALPAPPTYVTAVSAQDQVFVYLEAPSEGGRLSASVLRLDPQGHPLGEAATLVHDFAAPFGEVLTDGRALLVPGVSRQLGDLTEITVWRWSGDAVAVLLSCWLPAPRHGRVLTHGGEIFLVYETGTGALRGFATSLDEPECPSESDRVTLLEPPLPEGYLIDWVGDRLAVAGMSGDSYRLHLFRPGLEPARRLRLAAGGATDPADLALFALADGRSVALYSALERGARDIYLARLDQLSAGPLTGRRVVASAEAESSPHLVERGGWTVVSWRSLDSNRRDLLEIAAVLDWEGPAIPGGEVVWRHDVVRYPRFASVWTDRGLLRLWIDEEDDLARLVISPYQPSFWRRLRPAP